MLRGESGRSKVSNARIRSQGARQLSHFSSIGILVNQKRYPGARVSFRRDTGNYTKFRNVNSRRFRFMLTLVRKGERAMQMGLIRFAAKEEARRRAGRETIEKENSKETTTKRRHYNDSNTKTDILSDIYNDPTTLPYRSSLILSPSTIFQRNPRSTLAVPFL